MENLIWFILGMIFIIFILPVVESLSLTIQTWFEVVKSDLSVAIAKNNKEVCELNNSVEQSSVDAIGFVSGVGFDDMAYDDEDVDSLCEQISRSTKSKIGFLA